MRNTIKYISMAGASVFGLASCAPAEKQRPNILFILSDDHAKTGISAYEGIYSDIAPTPNIDAIAENGAIFDNMICTNAISGPSRACLVTGKYSTTNGFYKNEGNIKFDGDQQQYQKLLHDAGYTTGLFGKWHLVSDPQGFDTYMVHPGQGQYFNPLFHFSDGRKEHLQGYATTLTADAAMDWLDEVKDGEQPFCLMLHFKAPHRPWEPDKCYQDLFNDIEFPYPDTFNDDWSTREQTIGDCWATIEHHLNRQDLKQIPPKGLEGKAKQEWLLYGSHAEPWTPDPELKGEELKKWKYQTYIKDYFRVIRSVDDQVGRVVKYLKDNGLYENTIIVYMGDQGFFLGEHGIYDKRWMYEEAIQMPCLVSWPGKIEKGSRISDITLNVDIAPTLLDAAGLPIPEDMHGESMLDLLEGKEGASDNWRKSAYYHYFEYPKWHHVQPHYGIRTDRYKLIHFYYNIDVWEFYDMEKDPRELHNAYNDPQYADIIDSLKIELKELQKKYDDDMTFEERRALTDKVF